MAFQKLFQKSESIGKKMSTEKKKKSKNVKTNDMHFPFTTAGGRQLQIKTQNH